MLASMGSTGTLVSAVVESVAAADVVASTVASVVDGAAGNTGLLSSELASLLLPPCWPLLSCAGTAGG